MTTIEFRSATEKDEPGILDLFWQVAPRGTSLKYWQWQNIHGPHGPSLVELIMSGDNPIGHYAVRPMEIIFDGNSTKAGFAMQVCTHRSYRNLANLRKMCSNIWSRCEEKGLKFIYGFPNNNIWKIYQRMMDWQSVKRFYAHQLSLELFLATDLPMDDSITTDRIFSFDQDYDSIWNNSTQANSKIISIKRDSRYLNWRFFDSPEYHYKIYGAWKNNYPIGYIVLKFYHNGNEFTGHIIDLLTQREGQTEILSALITRAREAFKWQNVDSVSFWNNESHPAHQMYDNMGFTKDSFETQFGIRPIDTNFDWPIFDPQMWDLQMSESDAF